MPQPMLPACTNSFMPAAFSFYNAEEVKRPPRLLPRLTLISWAIFPFAKILLIRRSPTRGPPSLRCPMSADELRHTTRAKCVASAVPICKSRFIPSQIASFVRHSLAGPSLLKLTGRMNHPFWAQLSVNIDRSAPCPPCGFVISLLRAEVLFPSREVVIDP
jgi:hypothetical protein